MCSNFCYWTGLANHNIISEVVKKCLPCQCHAIPCHLQIDYILPRLCPRTYVRTESLLSTTTKRTFFPLIRLGQFSLSLDGAHRFPRSWRPFVKVCSTICRRAMIHHATNEPMRGAHIHAFTLRPRFFLFKQRCLLCARMGRLFVSLTLSQ